MNRNVADMSLSLHLCVNSVEGPSPTVEGLTNVENHLPYEK